MNIGELKEVIMNEFEKSNCKEGHIVPMRNFTFGLLTRLNPEEQKRFVDAVNSLIEEGKIVYEKDSLECLRLTKDGFDSLYKTSLSVNQLKGYVMQLFRDANCRVGHIVPMRQIQFGLMQKLNPKEQERLESAINELINEDYIEYRASSLESLALLQKGYNYIYNN